MLKITELNEFGGGCVKTGKDNLLDADLADGADY